MSPSTASVTHPAIASSGSAVQVSPPCATTVTVWAGAPSPANSRLAGSSVSPYATSAACCVTVITHGVTPLPSADTVIRPLRCSGAGFSATVTVSVLSSLRSAESHSAASTATSCVHSTPCAVTAACCVPLPASKVMVSGETSNDGCSVPVFPSQETIRKAAKTPPINTCVLIIFHSINQCSFCRLTFRHSAASAAADAPFTAAERKRECPPTQHALLHLTCITYEKTAASSTSDTPVSSVRHAAGRRTAPPFRLPDGRAGSGLRQSGRPCRHSPTPGITSPSAGRTMRRRDFRALHSSRSTRVPSRWGTDAVYSRQEP